MATSAVQANSITKNEIISSDSSSLFLQEKLTNNNSNSSSSIASTTSTNSSNSSCTSEYSGDFHTKRNSYDSQDNCITFIPINSNLINNSKTLHNQNDIKINPINTYNENNLTLNKEINECFIKHHGNKTLDFNKAKQLLLTLYNDFNNLSNNPKDNKLSIDAINNRFYVLVNISCSFIKVNKELNLNNNITDDDINDVSNFSELLYYESGLFTKDVILKYFHENKVYFFDLLQPLISTNVE
ncbi:MAG: hypothetical protein IJ848_01265 [Alphaproteobacteria bacterium]|nr:hypothetical protein [Alphaproteobacteria bacterium]